jgi:hypothetical protein
MSKIGRNDFHFVVSVGMKKMTCFTAEGHRVWVIDAHTEGQLQDRSASGGDTPLGSYLCGDITVTTNSDSQSTWNSYGEYFVDLLGQDGQEGPNAGRDGIGVHGGGTGLSDSLAPRQGWRATLGCIRLQNEDLVKFVGVVRICKGRSGKAWVTVQ